MVNKTCCNHDCRQGRDCPLQAQRAARQNANAPERIQLSRAKGWRMPENTVKVDRTGKPAPVGPMKGQVVQDKRHAFVLYRAFAPLNPTLIEAARKELSGKNLACWCGKDDPYEDACHAGVLLKIANPMNTTEAKS